ncbi:MAG: antA/AntB antirepressor family protein [Bacilli bacterium]
MSELLKVLKIDFEEQTVSARELYEEINNGKERFSKWFDRQLKFGFVDGEDFTSVLKSTVVNNGANKPLQDYNLSIDMAKQICMVQKTDKARNIRQQLIDLEKSWNTPEQVMARALKNGR